MVRTYKKKSDNKWTEDDMKNAALEKRMTISAAGRHYNIPKTTLIRHLGKTLKVGKPTVLSQSDETEIVSTCHLFVEWGFGLSKKEVINVVSEYIKAQKKPNPFKDGIPGDTWWLGFLKRHPQLVLRKPQQLQMARARNATPEIINYWFIECLKPALDELELADKPHNIDETGFH